MPPRGWEDAVERVFRRHGAGSLDSDPVQFPRRFRRADDREIAAFFAASLAYGGGDDRRFDRTAAPASWPAPHRTVTRERSARVPWARSTATIALL